VTHRVPEAQRPPPVVLDFGTPASQPIDDRVWIPGFAHFSAATAEKAAPMPQAAQVVETSFALGEARSVCRPRT